MKKGLGIRPVPAQQHLPDSQVTEWILDSNGEYDGEGRPLPRKRMRFDGSRPKALAQRRSWLSQLAGEQPQPEQPRAIPDVATLATALASMMTGAAVPATVTSLLASATKTRRTFAEFVKKEYLDHSLRVHDETTTPDRMKMLERYVLPVVGALSLEEANTVDAVDKLRHSLDEVIASRTRRKLMGNYKNTILIAFSSVLTVAKERELLPYKVTVGLYADRDIVPGQMLVTEHGYACGIHRHKRLPREHVCSLLAACQDDYEFVLVGLGLFLACRASEMPARLWTDIRWESSQVEIWSQVAWNRKTREHYIKRHTKNGVGGTLPVSQEFLEALERVRRKSTRDYILTPNDYSRREFLTRAALRCRFKEIAQRAKLPRLSYLHGLRHTFCCEHADSGLPAHEIQRLARHKKIATTYGYIDPSTERLKQAILTSDVFARR